MLMKRTSVIIPCYNHAHYLAQAIESALAQTRLVDEIIIVDDGSTDDTRDVAVRYGDNIRYIHQENQGLSAARNTGIRAATGDLIAFLDADDLWLPEYLATLVPVLEADPSLGAAYGGVQYVDEACRYLFQKTTRVVPPDQVHNTLIEGQFFPPQAVLMRKSCLDQVGLFDTTLCACEDWDMWLRLAASYPMIGTSQICALYRMHGTNMTRDLERMYSSHEAVCAKHWGKASGDPENWLPDKQRAYAGIYRWRACFHYSRGEVVEGKFWAKRALRARPQLAKNLDFFYSLGCGDQPPGQMGDLKSLNFEQNSRRLLEVLDSAFTDPTISAQLRAQRHSAYGTAYLALATLAYGGGHLGRARNWLTQAVRYQPWLIATRQWSWMLVRASAGGQVLYQMRRFKQALATLLRTVRAPRRHAWIDRLFAGRGARQQTREND